MNVITASNRIDKIGYETENGRTQVRFDLSDMMEEFPGGAGTLILRRPEETATVPASDTTPDGTDLVWTVSAYELEKRGILQGQIIYTVNGVVAKTRIYQFMISEALPDGTEPAPQGWSTWVNDLISAGNDIIAEIEDAEEMIEGIPGIVSDEIDRKIVEKHILTEETDPTVPEWAKQPTKPSYGPEEIGALPDNTFIPSKVSDLTNDSGYYVFPSYGIPASDIAEGVIPDVAGMKGSPNGLAELDENGKVPQSQLPFGQDYAGLSNKPRINNVELVGNKSLEDIGATSPQVVGEMISEALETENFIKKSELKSTTKADASSVSVSNVANRQYAVTPDKDGKLSVNVPWEDTDRAIPYARGTSTSGSTTTFNIWFPNFVYSEGAVFPVDFGSQVSNSNFRMNINTTGVKTLAVDGTTGSAYKTVSGIHMVYCKNNRYEIYLDGIAGPVDGVRMSSKLDRPAATGTSGQVLGLNSQLKPVWIDQTGGDVYVLPTVTRVESRAIPTGMVRTLNVLCNGPLLRDGTVFPLVIPEEVSAIWFQIKEVNYPDHRTDRMRIAGLDDYSGSVNFTLTPGVYWVSYTDTSGTGEYGQYLLDPDGLVGMRDKLSSAAIAPDYGVGQKRFYENELCTHDGLIYRANTNASETWNPAHWDVVELSELYTMIANINTSISSIRQDIQVATVAETEEIINEYGSGGDDQVVVYEAPYGIDDSWIYGYYETLDDAADIAATFKSGKSVMVHLVDPSNNNGDYYLQMLLYAEPYTDYDQECDAAFGFVYENIPFGTDDPGKTTNDIASFLGYSEVTQNGKLRIKYPAD